MFSEQLLLPGVVLGAWFVILTPSCCGHPVDEEAGSGHVRSCTPEKSKGTDRKPSLHCSVLLCRPRGVADRREGSAGITVTEAGGAWEPSVEVMFSTSGLRGWQLAFIALLFQFLVRKEDGVPAVCHYLQICNILGILYPLPLWPGTFAHLPAGPAFLKV